MTLTQKRLINLSILSIEKEIADNIALTSVVGEFAEAKARGVKLCFTYSHSLKEL